MSSDLVTVTLGGPPAGIDQSENPRRNSVYKSHNMCTHLGSWRKAPGWKRYAWGSGGQEPNYGIYSPSSLCLAEYTPVDGYSSSQQWALIHVLMNPTLTDTINARVVSFGDTYDTVSGNPRDIAIPSGLVAGAPWEKITSVQTLWKTEDSSGNSVYVPCLLFSNNGGDMFMYHQNAAMGDSSIDNIDILNSIDGGDSSVSYLANPPKGEALAIFKERVFTSIGKTIYWSGTDSALAFVCNVWPSEYNADVGEDGDITALIPWNDYLVIFKEREVYTLSGDGVGGNWSIRRVIPNVGAVNHQCVIDTGSMLQFVSKDGIYGWNGGQAVKLSHPQLEVDWDEVQVVPGGKNQSFAVYDQARNNSMFFLGTKDDYPWADYIADVPIWDNIPGAAFHPTDVLVLDNKHRAWSRWENRVSIATNVRRMTRRGPEVFACIDGHGYWDDSGSDQTWTSQTYCLLSDRHHGWPDLSQFLFEYPSTITYPLVYNEYFAGFMSNLIVPAAGRHFSVHRVRVNAVPFQGDQSNKLAVYVALGDRSIPGSLVMDSKYWTALVETDAVAKQTHNTLTGDFESAARGPVEKWSKLTGSKYSYSGSGELTLQTASGSNEIKFAVAQTAVRDDLIVLPNLFRYQSVLTKSPDRNVLSTDDSKWDQCTFIREEPAQFEVKQRGIARSFRLIVESPDSGMMDVHEVQLMLRPRRTWR